MVWLPKRWCLFPRVQALLPDSVTVAPTPKLPTQFRFNCSLSPSRISSTLPPFTDPSLIPGPKHSQMHSFDFSVLNESSPCKVLLTLLSAEFWTSLVTQTVKNLRPMQETQDWPPGSGRFPWRREWLPTPVCLPGEFHGQRKLVGYRPWGSKGLATTENSTFTYSLGALFSYLTKAGEIV